jgi:hypothetical protein
MEISVRLDHGASSTDYSLSTALQSPKYDAIIRWTYQCGFPYIRSIKDSHAEKPPEGRHPDHH